MAAGVEYDEDSQDSLAQEDVFLAETTRFAESVVGIYGEIKQRKRSQGTGLATAKGLTQSRVQSSSIVLGPSTAAASPSVSQQQVDPSTAQRVQFAERLWEIAEKHDKVLVQQYDKFFQLDGKSSVWDITYGVFKRTCTRVLHSAVGALAGRREQILLVFANCFYVYEELKQAGADIDRQNEFLKFAGRYLVEHGFQPWIHEQGGLDKMVGSSEDVAALIEIPEDPPM